MANKTQNLKAAYKDLKDGHVIDCNGCRVYIEYSEHGNREYIFWENFGRSAERLGIQNLRWIFRVIAKSPDYAYKLVA